MENKKGTKIELPHLRHAIELMCAGTDPITLEQLEDFCRHPGGPILPERCVGVERLEIEQGAHEKLLGVTERGEPICLAVERAGYRIGTRKYCFRHIQVLRLLGFMDGEPVLLACGGRIIRHGEVMLYDPNMLNAWVLPSGRCFVAQDEGSRHTILYEVKSGRIGTRDLLWRSPERWVPLNLFEEPTGVMYARCVVPRKETGMLLTITGRGPCFDLVCPSSVMGVRHQNKEGVAFFEHEKRRLYLLHELARRIHEYADGSLPPLWQSPYSNAYLGGLRQLNSATFAYVGRSLRHKLECWVVEGVGVQPGFERVTRELFEQDGKHYYYGQIGRHLYKMELPIL